MKSNWIRFVAGLLVSVALVGAVALTDGMKSGKRTDGLMYQASGLHPDGEILTVNGVAVSCEEYLFWLGQDCSYLLAQVENLDWDEMVTDEMTFAEYAEADALETVKQYAVLRQWAKEAGVTLTEEDTAELAALREQYVSYYGSEEAYQTQLALLGVSETLWDEIQSAQQLIERMYLSICEEGGSLYPDEATLAQYETAEAYYDAMWSERLANANVVVNSELYHSINVGDFADKLTQLRAEMMSGSSDEAA